MILMAPELDMETFKFMLYESLRRKQAMQDLTVLFVVLAVLLILTESLAVFFMLMMRR